MINETNKKIGIVADSCTDLPEEIRNLENVHFVPLKIRVAGGKEYEDDGTINIDELLLEIEKSKKGVGSACPTVDEYMEAMLPYDECYVVTISAKLSGSHNAASVAANMIREEHPEKKIHVFDTKSATSGESETVYYLLDAIKAGLSYDKIVMKTTIHISKMHTLFILEDLSILRQNGRLGKVTGLVASMLSLCPIMTAVDGEIQALHKIRGIKKSLAKLVDTVVEYTKNSEKASIRLIMSYCDCEERATNLKKELLDKCSALKEVIMVHTGGLSSTYANRGGVILAFTS